MGKLHSLSLQWQEKVQMFLIKHPLLRTKKYHLFGLAVSFWPIIIFGIELSGCYAHWNFGCGFLSMVFTILGIPSAILIFPFAIPILSILPIHESYILALSLILNPIMHYIAGMWLGYFLRKTSMQTQKRVLQFFFLTPILILFLFWRYG